MSRTSARGVGRPSTGAAVAAPAVGDARARQKQEHLLQRVRGELGRPLHKPRRSGWLAGGRVHPCALLRQAGRTGSRILAETGEVPPSSRARRQLWRGACSAVVHDALRGSDGGGDAGVRWSRPGRRIRLALLTRTPMGEPTSRSAVCCCMLVTSSRPSSASPPATSFSISSRPPARVPCGGFPFGGDS